MRRQLEIKSKKDVIISKDRLNEEDFITDSLFHFSEKNEYEIHLLEEILESIQETNQLLKKVSKKGFLDKATNTINKIFD